MKSRQLIIYFDALAFSANFICCRPCFAEGILSSVESQSRTDLDVGLSIVKLSITCLEMANLYCQYLGIFKR